jgi:hypothetical protein
VAEGCVASPELAAVPPPSTIHRLLEFIPRSDESAGASAVERDASALSWEGRFARNAEARESSPESKHASPESNA